MVNSVPSLGRKSSVGAGGPKWGADRRQAPRLEGESERVRSVPKRPSAEGRYRSRLGPVWRQVEVLTGLVPKTRMLPVGEGRLWGPVAAEMDW
ncbi:hypothetical protein CRG98_026941 [Punica granatum]|uniref:Uncharacterized protein n=1 Tax=Punica granatum TaxID=22663 RepID=A0A2I0J8U6_PUNGR|nr:hypothetical protein CRG98_026941 [Punica granatum]